MAWLTPREFPPPEMKFTPIAGCIDKLSTIFEREGPIAFHSILKIRASFGLNYEN